MSIHGRLYRALVPRLKNHPRLWNLAQEVDHLPGLIRHAAAPYFPQVIVPQPRQLTVSITSFCNLRCVGCRYGRDFMPNTELSFQMVRDMLDDAKEVGFEIVRLYGGEPLLHRGLPRMVEHAMKLGLRVYVTTNGILLREKIDELYAAGLRQLSIGFYGVGADYNAYVQRREQYARLEESVAYVRQQYGQSVSMGINWLLMRPSCNEAALHQAYQFAVKYALTMSVDLIHHSLPYFSEGPDRMLQFRPEDRLQIERLLTELIRLQEERPDVIAVGRSLIRSIPDWLIKGPEMRVPCEAYQLVWVGPDGTVQMCYVTFRLGNLHEKRLRDMMFTETHRQAARDAYALNCPNCHCHASIRIKRDLPSRLMYLKRQTFENEVIASPSPHGQS